MAGPAHDAGVLRLTETGRVALRTEARGSLKRDPREKKTKRAGTGPGQCSAGAACCPAEPSPCAARRPEAAARTEAPRARGVASSARGARPTLFQGRTEGSSLPPSSLRGRARRGSSSPAGSMALFWPRDELSSHSAALRPESRSGPAGHGSVPFWGLPPTCFSHRVFSLNKFLKSPKVFK